MSTATDELGELGPDGASSRPWPTIVAFWQQPFLETICRKMTGRVASYDRARFGLEWPRTWVISADIGQKRRASVVYTFTSPFSFSSAAKNGPFFFWFR